VNDPNQLCELHELSNCAICYPPAKTYRKGALALDVPSGHYIEIQPGTGTYHHPDCFMATADWDGAGSAKLGKRIARSPQEIQQLELRPAQCCEPPIFRRSRSAT
jgi:hypothetical protein